MEKYLIGKLYGSKIATEEKANKKSAILNGCRFEMVEDNKGHGIIHDV